MFKGETAQDPLSLDTEGGGELEVFFFFYSKNIF